MDRKDCLVKLALVSALCVPFIGCDSSHTAKSGSSDLDSVYVAGDDADGKIELTVENSTIAVGETGNFVVSVTGQNNTPVSDMRVACDSEKGIAIVEPNTGYEMTNGAGVVSGVIGCEYAGSFRFGCRLPVGVNKRKFVSIRCEGLGEASWPGAAGGGLGGGSQGEDADGDIRVSEVVFTDHNEEGTIELDAMFNLCCVKCPTEDTDEEKERENFTSSDVKFKIVNDTSLAVTFTSYTYAFSKYASQPIAMNFRILGNSSAESSYVPFLENLVECDEDSVCKRAYGYEDALDEEEDFGVQNVSFTLYGTDSANNAVSLTLSKSVNIGSFNTCDEHKACCD